MGIGHIISTITELWILLVWPVYHLGLRMKLLMQMQKPTIFLITQVLEDRLKGIWILVIVPIEEMGGRIQNSNNRSEKGDAFRQFLLFAGVETFW